MTNTPLDSSTLTVAQARPAPLLRRWFGHARSVAGRAHENSGLPCQDASRCFDGPDVAIAIVADGAGSKKHSAQGAQVAVEHTMQWLRALNNDDIVACDAPWLVRVIHEVVRAQVVELAEQNGHDPQEYSATLAFVIACGTRFIAANLGDGLIFGVRDGQTVVLAAQDRGEFANVTCFLTTAGAQDRWTIHVGDSRDFHGFVLCTDGVGDTLLHRPTGRAAGAVEQIVRWFSQASAQEVRQSIDTQFLPMARQRTTDDCSVALISRTVLSLQQLQDFEPARQQEYLGVKNRRGLRNRLQMTRELLGETDVPDSDKPARRHYMDPRTAHRHAEFVRRLLENHEAPRETT
jgi:hypothetical protein